MKSLREYLFGVPMHVLAAFIQKERDAGEPWSGEAVRVFVRLDLDKGEIRNSTEYARQWNWNVKSDDAGRKRVRRAWPGIVRDVVNWATSFGRQIDPRKYPHVAHIPEEWWDLPELADLKEKRIRALSRERPNDVRENGHSGSLSHTRVREVSKESPPDVQFISRNARTRHPTSQHPASNSINKQQQSSTSLGARDCVEDQIDDARIRFEMLIKKGVERKTAERFAATFPDRVERQVRHLHYLISIGHPPDDPPAWLVSAIGVDYPLPDKLKQRLSDALIPTGPQQIACEQRQKSQEAGAVQVKRLLEETYIEMDKNAAHIQNLAADKKKRRPSWASEPRHL